MSLKKPVLIESIKKQVLFIIPIDKILVNK